MNRFLTILIGFILCSCFVGEELPPDQDVWEYKSPSFVSMNAESLFDVDGDVDDFSYESVNGLIMIKDDKLVFENYYRGSVRSSLQNSGLITFATMILALDIFIEDGLITSIDDPIYSYLPEYENLFEADTIKKYITIKHLIENKSGLSWDEEARVIDDFAQMRSSDDWVFYILAKQPDTPTPGLRFSLNSANGIVLAHIMQNTLSVPLEDYLKEHLLEKVGITDYEWEKSPNGTLNGSRGLRLSTLDMTKLGYLMLLEGRWTSRQRVIRRDWIFDIAAPQSVFSDRFSYGYGTKVLTEEYKEEQAVLLNGTSIYYIDGGQGQAIYVVPEFELVVTIAAENLLANSEIYTFALFYRIVDSIESIPAN